MRLVDDYIDEYIDRNMEALMAEWQLTTKRGTADLRGRIAALEKEITPIATFEAYASGRLAELEERLKKIKEGL